MEHWRNQRFLNIKQRFLSGFQTTIWKPDHLTTRHVWTINARLVWYSDGYCIVYCIGKTQYCGAIKSIEKRLQMWCFFYIKVKAFWRRNYLILQGSNKLCLSLSRTENKCDKIMLLNRKWTCRDAEIGVQPKCNIKGKLLRTGDIYRQFSCRLSCNS